MGRLAFGAGTFTVEQGFFFGVNVIIPLLLSAASEKPNNRPGPFQTGTGPGMAHPGTGGTPDLSRSSVLVTRGSKHRKEPRRFGPDSESWIPKPDWASRVLVQSPRGSELTTLPAPRWRTTALVTVTCT
jgi:hypothetical protein